jgi:hypothetical protein
MPRIEKNEMGGTCSTYQGEEAYTGFWWENQRGIDHWGNTGVEGKVILWWIFRKLGVGVWFGLSWFRIDTFDGNFWMRKWTFALHKMRRISWLAANRLNSQEGLCCVEWVSKERYFKHITVV